MTKCNWISEPVNADEGRFLYFNLIQDSIMSHSCGHSDPPWKEILRLGNLRGNIKSQQDVLAATIDTEWTVLELLTPISSIG